MKRPVFQFLMLFFFLPLWVQGVAASNGAPTDYTLTVYEGNSYVQMTLAETGNPGNHVTVEEHSGSRYENLGHPGNIAYFDSPPTLLGNALTSLMRKLRADDPYLVSVNIKHFQIFIAGYDVFADAYICTKRVDEGSTAPGYINEEKAKVAGAKGPCLVSDDGEVVGKRLKREHFLELVREKLFVNAVSFDGEVVLTGDDRLHNAAATEIPDPATDQTVSDVDVVHVTSCAWGDQIREGKVVEGPGVAASNPRDGGYFQIGKKICTEHSSNVPDDLNAWSQLNDPVLAAMNTFPLAKGYYKATGEHLFNRYKRGFLRAPQTLYANEQGYMGTEIIANDAPYGFNDTLWKDAQQILTAYVIGAAREEKSTQEQDSSVINEVVDVIQKLSKLPQTHTASGELPKIRLVGEFPWKRLGFFPAIKQRLPKELADRLEILADSEYQLVTSKASQRFTGLYPVIAKASEETQEDVQLEPEEARQEPEETVEPEASLEPEEVQQEGEDESAEEEDSEDDDERDEF